MTRDQLISKLSRRWLIGKRPATERLDAVLDELLEQVEREVRPVVEKSWEGNDVLAIIRRFKSDGGRR
jgi:hypothetical protein